MKNAKIFQSDLVVTGDLPWSMKNTKIFQNDENAKIFQSGLVVMGDLPGWNFFGGGEKCKDFSKWFHCNG